MCCSCLAIVCLQGGFHPTKFFLWTVLKLLLVRPKSSLLWDNRSHFVPFHFLLYVVHICLLHKWTSSFVQKSINSVGDALLLLPLASLCHISSDKVEEVIEVIADKWQEILLGKDANLAEMIDCLCLLQDMRPYERCQDLNVSHLTFVLQQRRIMWLNLLGF